MNKLAMFSAISIFIIIYVGTNVYIGNKLFQLLAFISPTINGLAFSLIYSAVVMAVIMMFMPIKGAFKRIASWIGSYWMGFYIYFLLFFVVVDIFLLVAKWTSLIASPLSQSVRFYCSLLVIIGTVLLVAYGIYNARQIKHKTYSIKTKQAKQTTRMKIVLITDLHLGAVYSEQRLEKIVNEVNAQQPDIVCIVGDIFNDDYFAIKEHQRISELFKNISTTHGVYSCLGNHDGGATLSHMLDFLEHSQVKALHDDYVIIDEKLILVGRLDGSPIGGYGQMKRTNMMHTITALNSPLPVIVMDHTPNQLEQYGEDIDLVLAGHTHKGQVFPGNLITSRLFEVDYGYYQKDAASPQVIVSSGAGTWGMPMRVGSHCEIVTIFLN